MSLKATCNARDDDRRCGQVNATWVIVQLAGHQGYLSRYETALCTGHVAGLVASGATIFPLHADLLTA